jgi:Na+-transporting methylmalonyl-CoA/oxaloacetate decarboxylase gamma subunit
MMLLAISLPEQPTLADNLQYQLTGLLVVLFTLGALALLVALLGRVISAFESRSTPAPSPVAASAPAAPEAISGPVFAAIAAAVSTALGDHRFVIRGVQAVDPRENLAWGAEGRRSIYASHQVR